MYVCNIMINSSKISIRRFIATTLFRVVKEWPHSSGNIHESPLRVERCPKFILFKFEKYVCMCVCMYVCMSIFSAIYYD